MSFLPLQQSRKDLLMKTKQSTFRKVKGSGSILSHIEVLLYFVALGKSDHRVIIQTVISKQNQPAGS